MTWRHKIYLGVIALLGAINLGRWWLPEAPWQQGSRPVANRYAPEDFQLHADSGAVRNTARRNLFEPAGRSEGGLILRTKSVSAAVKLQAPSLPTPAETAGADLSRLKLLGVVFRAGAGQAYLAHDRESVLAHNGDTVFGHYAVEQIQVDAVDLKDLNTNLSRRIPVSGK